MAKWLKDLDRKLSVEDCGQARRRAGSSLDAVVRQETEAGPVRAPHPAWAPDTSSVELPGVGLSSWVYTAAKFRAHPSCQGTLSLQLLLSNGFLLPRYGFGFNNS